MPDAAQVRAAMLTTCSLHAGLLLPPSAFGACASRRQRRPRRRRIDLSRLEIQVMRKSAAAPRDQTADDLIGGCVSTQGVRE
jgi:hypothetical protein